jgi:D-glycero-D-manno-heptose 1,7-bisphosphate phosphatase
MALPRLASGPAEKRHQMVTRAIFADRDGVLCANMTRDGRPVAPTRLEDFRLLPGVEDSVRALKSAGYLVIVVTNQPDVGTGRTPRAIVEAMHDIIRSTLDVDDIKACFHTNADGCACRKPKPGMILEAAAERAIDLPASFVVGDRWSDVAAGREAGCSTIFVDYGHEPDTPAKADRVVSSFAEAARVILGRGN